MAYVNQSVNWRLGCVSEFESYWLIGQKYAFLNKISTAELVRDLHRLTPTRTTEYISCRWIESVDVNALVKLLGEPRKRLESSRHERFVPKLFHDHALVEGSVVDDLRLCEQCIRFGFHSPIHQLPWLDRCLIHQTILGRGCPHCGRTLEYRTRPDGFISANAVVHQLYCGCGKPIWPAIHAAEWPERLRGNALRPIRDYLRWVDTMEAVSGFCMLPKALDFFEDGHKTPAEKSWIVRCLASLHPPPSCVVRALNGPVIRPEFHTVPSPDVPATSVTLAIDRVGYRALLLAYEHWLEMIGESAAWIPLVKRAAKELIYQHRTCYASWMRVRRARFHAFAGENGKLFEICPAVLPTARFKSIWDSSNRAASRSQALWSLSIASRLSDTAVVAVLSPDCPEATRALTAYEALEVYRRLPASIDVCKPMRMLLDRMWALEVRRSAAECAAIDGRDFVDYADPFESSQFKILAPLVLVEPSDEDHLKLWIWLRSSPYGKAVRQPFAERRRHRRLVTSFAASELAEAADMEARHDERRWPSITP